MGNVVNLEPAQVLKPVMDLIRCTKCGAQGHLGCDHGLSNYRRGAEKYEANREKARQRQKKRRERAASRDATVEKTKENGRYAGLTQSQAIREVLMEETEWAVEAASEAYRGPVDLGVVNAVQKAADAWAKLAAQIKERYRVRRAAS
jgi:hypothetical protein